MIETLA